MRPTDEDQAGSRRPNLMSPSPPSSRRGNGEVNILAMLDGQTDPPLSRRVLALPAIVWYGLAGVLVCALLGALAWLLRDPDSGRTGARDGAAMPPTPITMPAAAPLTTSSAQAQRRAEAPAAADAAASAAANSAPAHGATIVNLAPAAGDVAQAAADAAPGQARHRASPDAAAVTVRAGRKDSPGKVRAARLAARPDGTPRKRPAVPAQPGAAPGLPDTDVALISAIIQHVNKQGGAPDGGATNDIKDAKDAKSPTNRR